MITIRYIRTMRWMSHPIWHRTSELVRGHFRGDRYAGPAFRMTFLPECAARSHRRFLAEQPDILAFAQGPTIHNLRSETCFGGVDHDRFDFIGVYERRREDLLRLSQRLGIGFDIDLHLNETKKANTGEHDIRAGSSVVAARDHLSNDVALYERLFNRHA